MILPLTPSVNPQASLPVDSIRLLEEVALIVLALSIQSPFVLFAMITFFKVISLLD